MTEQQAYEVLEQLGDVEVRRCPEHLLAETVVNGPFELAGNVAFPRLARYIGGHNRSSRTMAMTAPVMQEEDSQGAYVVGFVMPAGVSAEDLPDPMHPQVHTRRVPAETVAALRFSGRWSRRSFEKHRDELVAALRAADIEVVGSARFARFDPPWKPWFQRRNEVVVPIRLRTKGGTVTAT